LPLALVAVAWSSFTVVLSEELGTAAYLVLLLAGWIVFVGAAGYWMSRAGRKSDPVSAPRIEVVSLSGGQGVGTVALRAVDRVFGAPAALARAVARDDKEESAAEDAKSSDTL